MGFHEYIKIWEPKFTEILEVKLDPTSKMDKFAVAVIKNKKIIGHFLLGKTGGVSKTVFYFLRWECNDCQEKIGDGKAVNLGDGMGMRVSFLFCRQN